MSANTKPQPSHKDDDAPTPFCKLVMGQVQPRLWLGSLQALRELKHEQRASWTILSILHSDTLIHFAETAVHELDVVRQHVVWKLADQSESDLLCPRLMQVLDTIEEGLDHGCVLVHCAFGLSRSAAVCAAYLMTRHSDTRCCSSLQTAMETIRCCRPDVRPNMGFVAALHKLERLGSVEAAMQQQT